MNANSKYQALVMTTDKKVSIKSKDLEDLRQESLLKSKIKRIDEETALKIEEINNTPIDNDLIKAQAKSDLDTTKREHKRATINIIHRAEDDIKDAELSLSNAQKEAETLTKRAEHNVQIAKRNLELLKEESVEIEEAENLRARQLYEREIASIGNIEQTLKLRIQKAKMEGERKKQELQAELDSILAKKSAQDGIVKEWDILYNDLKEISLKLGDK